jgi:hypothetical protein
MLVGVYSVTEKQSRAWFLSNCHRAVPIRRSLRDAEITRHASRIERCVVAESGLNRHVVLRLRMRVAMPSLHHTS